MYKFILKCFDINGDIIKYFNYFYDTDILFFSKDKKNIKKFSYRNNKFKRIFNINDIIDFETDNIIYCDNNKTFITVINTIKKAKRLEKIKNLKNVSLFN